MSEFYKQKDRHWASDEMSDTDDAEILHKRLSEEYPNAKVSHVELDRGEWIEPMYDDNGDLDYDGYYDSYFEYRVDIRFETDEDEAEFLIRESIHENKLCES